MSTTITPKEAITVIRNLQDWLYFSSMNGGTKIQREALDIAVNAIEKQIPMKAVGTHYAHMRCPSCNHRIPSGGGSSSRRRDNWCNYCGQKIDWSENNETN